MAEQYRVAALRKGQQVSGLMAEIMDMDTANQERAAFFETRLRETAALVKSLESRMEQMKADYVSAYAFVLNVGLHHVVAAMSIAILAHTSVSRLCLA